MLIANLSNTEHSIDVDIQALLVQSLAENHFFKGSTARTIDGTLVSYADGYKNEVALNCQEISRSIVSVLRTAQRLQYEMDFTVTDEYDGSVIYSYTGVIDDFNPEFNNRTRLFSASIKVLEI